jgi:hypothetical protein
MNGHIDHGLGQSRLSVLTVIVRDRVFNNQPLLLRVGLVGCQAPIQSLMSLHKQPINL